MRVALAVVSGPDEGRSFTVEEGPELRVGRKAPSHVVLASDPTLSRAHFSIACNERVCRVRDLDSTAGTEINGVRVSEAFVNDGDVIVAGLTTLVVRFLTPPTSRSRPVKTGSDREATLERDSIADPYFAVLVELHRAAGALFAVLDAARDPLVLARLVHGNEHYQSLYEGIPGQQLAAFAPYLVSLPAGSALLELLVREGWGKSWGVYFTSDQPFPEVRKHLRRFLIVKTEAGQQLYFRYYDPRVLRVYLPTCDPAELTGFFGPIRGFLMEDADCDDVVTFGVQAGRLNRAVVAIGRRPPNGSLNALGAGVARAENP